MMGRVTGGTDEGRQAVIAQGRGRMGTPEEIAATVLCQRPDAASFVAGAAIVADGAQTT